MPFLAGLIGIANADTSGRLAVKDYQARREGNATKTRLKGFQMCHTLPHHAVMMTPRISVRSTILLALHSFCTLIFLDIAGPLHAVYSTRDLGTKGCCEQTVALHEL